MLSHNMKIPGIDASGMVGFYMEAVATCSCVTHLVVTIAVCNIALQLLLQHTIMHIAAHNETLRYSNIALLHY